MVQGERVYKFTELDAKIGKRDGVKLANNTYAHRIDKDKIGIKLHYTDVVVLNSDNTYNLYTGGWYTRTTLDRLNGFSPARVRMKKGELYINVDQCGFKGAVSFTEGVTVDQWGEVIKPNPLEPFLHTIII
jgi:hypothetical protein